MKATTGSFRNTTSALNAAENTLPQANQPLDNGAFSNNAVNDYRALNFNTSMTDSRFGISPTYATSAGYAFTGNPGSAPAPAAAAILGAIDHVGPVTGELSNGAQTDDPRPTFHGTGTPGEVINLSATAIGADGKPAGAVQILGNALVQADGSWQFTAPLSLKEGTYDFHAGQGIQDGDAFRLVIDKSSAAPQPPAPAHVEVLGALDDSGATIEHLSQGAHTRDATPTLFGSGQPGEVLHLSATLLNQDGSIARAGVPLGDTTVQADGTWQFTVPTLVQGGLYAFQVDAASGQSSTFALTYDSPTTPVPEQHTAAILGAIDHVGPVTGELANGASTDDSRPTFHGTGTPGELLNLSAIPTDASGHASSNVVLNLGSVLVQADGTWQFTAPFAIQDGSYDFHVGHGATDGEAFHLVIEHSAAPVPVDPLPQPEPQPEPHPQPATAAILGATDHVGPVTGELANGASTDDTRPTFHGTGNPGELLNVSAIPTDASGHAASGVILNLGTALVQHDGTWQFTPAFAMKEGTYDFYVGHGATEGNAFHLVIDKSSAQLPSSSGTTLPQLGELLEMGAGHLEFGAQQSVHDGHYAASGGQFDMRPTLLEELNNISLHTL